MTSGFFLEAKEILHLASTTIVSKIQDSDGLDGQSYPPPVIRGQIAGLIKGNQWLINPDHKALFLRRGGGFGGAPL